MSLSQVKLTDPRSLRAYAHPLRMSLIGLLRREGPMTATQAAAELGEAVANCSFHLRQLAKYGLAERSPAGDGRERPWRATAQSTSWADDSPDPEMRAATDQLNAVILANYVRRAEEYLTRRGAEPTEWRMAAGFGDRVLHVTADELIELNDQIDALYARYDHRQTDPAARPAGARAVLAVELTFPVEAPRD
ncbi:helix-turn-helix domain-containing protein [Spirilliplanes yamanashiensis]|uniref:Transcriptional regulator n=1 Tax=Spirilliplanes yamanashiensis TaxID=42233 RepID=A0A8J4DJW7_9ACTN|nr:helix-turn-helix domain-containing protein [Spirilliplanes yamanashiensis]MDP9815418.1 putative ArsR family transcriptional regulator [Spirilliplanes yamanashiensis]GIJ03673.1 transcriptional regulator [Spirilliplanes yamanashiensis]